MFDSISVNVLGNVGFFPTKDTLKVLIFTIQKVLAEMGSFTSEIPVFINLFSFTVDHQEI